MTQPLTIPKESLEDLTARLAGSNAAITHLQQTNAEFARLITYLRTVLEKLVIECETNADFAVNPHGTEAEELERARELVNDLKDYDLRKEEK